MEVVVNSPNVKYTENYIEANYDYHTTKVERRGQKFVVSTSLLFQIITYNRKLMLKII